MILFLESSDGEAALVLLVSLPGQWETTSPPPGDAGCGCSTGRAGEGDSLTHAPQILILRSQFDGWRIPDMDLHDATGATGSMSVVRSAGVVSCVSLGHLEKRNISKKTLFF